MIIKKWNVGEADEKDWFTEDRAERKRNESKKKLLTGCKLLYILYILHILYIHLTLCAYYCIYLLLCISFTVYLLLCKHHIVCPHYPYIILHHSMYCKLLLYTFLLSFYRLSTQGRALSYQVCVSER